uniref:Uncharacterized protein n=1 Tax=Magallana gigas TaxID=29159 RepID=K1QPV0_MAGGI
MVTYRMPRVHTRCRTQWSLIRKCRLGATESNVSSVLVSVTMFRSQQVIAQDY